MDERDEERRPIGSGWWPIDLSGIPMWKCWLGGVAAIGLVLLASAVVPLQAAVWIVGGLEFTGLIFYNRHRKRP